MTQSGVPIPDATHDEIVALIMTLQHAEQRLEELTGGEVDTVSVASGRPFLLRKAQEDLRRSGASKQAAILNALPAHVALLDAEGVIVSVNETWRQFGVANDLRDPLCAVGVNYLDACDRAEGVGSGGAHEAGAGIRGVMEGATSFSLEYPCHSPTISRWFQMTVTPMGGSRAHGVVVMHLDVTARKEAEAALRASEQEFRTLAQSMPQIVWITRPDGWNTYFSQQWMDYTGLTLEESVGQGWNTPFHPDDRLRAWDAWQLATATRGTYSIESRLRRADGAYRWWLVRGVPQLGADDQVVKWFGTCTDIHELKLAELEVVRSNQALQRQQDELRVLFDLIPAMIWFKDTHDRILRVKQRVADVAGKPI
jgi:PAS domain S-box-containing protein